MILVCCAPALNIEVLHSTHPERIRLSGIDCWEKCPTLDPGASLQHLKRDDPCGADHKRFVEHWVELE